MVLIVFIVSFLVYVYLGIMIRSVFSVFLIKLHDLLVFIGICLFIHVIDNLFG